MKIFIAAKPNARKSEVVKIDNAHFKVSIDASPEKGKANARLIELLSDYFKIPKSRIWVSSGLTTKNKIIEII